MPDYWSNLINSMDFWSRMLSTEENFITSSSLLIDERKTVKVLKAETLTCVFSSSNPFWKIDSKPLEYSIRSLSSNEYSHMISMRYIIANLMFKASTDDRVVMIWMSSLSCFLC